MYSWIKQTIEMDPQIKVVEFIWQSFGDQVGEKSGSFAGPVEYIVVNNGSFPFEMMVGALNVTGERGLGYVQERLLPGGIKRGTVDWGSGIYFLRLICADIVGEEIRLPYNGYFCRGYGALIGHE